MVVGTAWCQNSSLHQTEIKQRMYFPDSIATHVYHHIIPSDLSLDFTFLMNKNRARNSGIHIHILISTHFCRAFTWNKK